MASGEPLNEVEREAMEGLDFARKTGSSFLVALILGHLCLIRSSGACRTISDPSMMRSSTRAISSERFEADHKSGDCCLLVLDPKIAGVRLRRGLCGSSRSGCQGASLSLDFPHSSSWPSTTSMLRWRERGLSIPSMLSEIRDDAPGSLDGAPPATPDLGRTLP